VGTRRAVGTLSPGPGERPAAVSRDARRVALAGPESAVRVWDVPAARWLPGAVPAHAGVRRAAFSPDGGQLLLADDAGGLRRWDAANGRPTGPRLRHDGPLSEVVYHSGGQLVAVSRGGLVRLWDLPSVTGDAGPEFTSFEELVALAEVLACGRVDDEQAIRAFDAAQWRAAYARLAAIRSR
jgi:WD40 repeat protein